MLEIEGLATAYGKIEALKGVTLSAKTDQVTCMLGPNGAGKTTLMMTLAGILKPLRGSIRFDVSFDRGASHVRPSLPPAGTPPAAG